MVPAQPPRETRRARPRAGQPGLSTSAGRARVLLVGVAGVAAAAAAAAATLTVVRLASTRVISKDPNPAAHKNTLTASTARHNFQMYLPHECKQVFFVRHAEGTHNRDSRALPDFFQGRHTSPEYVDARLTDVGEKQCHALAQQVAQNDGYGIELAVTSPLTRTLQTAELAFGLVGPEKRPPFVATELARERIAEFTSDQRRSISVLRREFPFVDFSECEHDEDVWFAQRKETHPSPYDSHLCKDRALEFLDWLHARKEQRIAVFTHWVFLQHLMSHFRQEQPAGVRAHPDLALATFGNAELRVAHLCRGAGAGAPTS